MNLWLERMSNNSALSRDWNSRPLVMLQDTARKQLPLGWHFWQIGSDMQGVELSCCCFVAASAKIGMR